MPFAHTAFTEQHGSRRAVDPYGHSAHCVVHNHGDGNEIVEVDIILCEWPEWLVRDESRDPATWTVSKWTTNNLVVATRVGVHGRLGPA